MKTRPQDIFWGAVAVLLALLCFVSLAWLLYDRNRAVQTLIAVIPGALIAVGAWRRTKWGAPEGGLRAEQEKRAVDRRP